MTSPKKPLVLLETLHRENIERFDVLASEVRTHITDDVARFNTLDNALHEISHDVKSLLATRSFNKGVWWAVTIIAGSIATVTSMAIAWVKG